MVFPTLWTRIFRRHRPATALPSPRIFQWILPPLKFSSRTDHKGLSKGVRWASSPRSSMTTMMFASLAPSRGFLTSSTKTDTLLKPRISRALVLVPHARTNCTEFSNPTDPTVSKRYLVAAAIAAAALGPFANKSQGIEPRI
ncbi:g2831 [Coccomyxa elongata]